MIEQLWREQTADEIDREAPWDGRVYRGVSNLSDCFPVMKVAAGALLVEDLEAAVEQMAVEYLRIERGWRDGTLSPDTRGVMATLLAAAAGEGEG